MKNYNPQILNTYLNEVKKSKNSIPTEYIVMANNIAKKQDKSYARVGVMDINDLIQESNLALVKGWNNIDWKYINSVPKLERKNAIHGYLYKTITLSLKTAVNDKRDGIRIPDGRVSMGYSEGKQQRSGDPINIITALFPNWFGSEEMDKSYMQEHVDDYANEQLGLFLDDLLINILKITDYQIITWFYGIDMDKRMSYKEIADRLNSNHTAIQVRKKRIMDNMIKSEEVKDKIAVFLYDNDIKTQSDAYQWLKTRNLRK